MLPKWICGSWWLNFEFFVLNIAVKRTFDDDECQLKSIKSIMILWNWDLKRNANQMTKMIVKIECLIEKSSYLVSRNCTCIGF